MKKKDNSEREKRALKLKKSQDENAGWWNKFTEDQKIAMGLRYPYYKHIDFSKTDDEKKELKRLKIRYKLENSK